jgi:hypothetical protein
MTDKKPKQLVAKAIYLEWRRPESKLEKQCYGVTTTDNNVARIFFNTGLKGSTSNTFFHEMTHVFFAFHRHNVPDCLQEKLAQKIGTICSEVLR